MTTSPADPAQAIADPEWVRHWVLASPPPQVRNAIVWHTPRQEQGQLVLHAYSRGILGDADVDGPWMRVTDETNRVSYYRAYDATPGYHPQCLAFALTGLYGPEGPCAACLTAAGADPSKELWRQNQAATAIKTAAIAERDHNGYLLRWHPLLASYAQLGVMPEAAQPEPWARPGAAT